MKRSFGVLILLISIIVLAAGGARGQSIDGSGADASITGLSRAFNPAISLNGLFYGMGTSAPDEAGHDHDGEHHHHGLEPGVHLQEAELVLSANVDVYLRADATLSYHGDGFEVENLYLTTLQLPAHLQVRAGKFHAPFGLHNRLHTHAFPFVEAPLVLEEVFGHHGWIDTGAEVSWLAPLPWYLEVTAAGFDGAEETAFHSDRKSDYAGLGRVETLFDLGDAATFRAGGSFAWGPTLLESDTAAIPDEHVINQVWGADVQLKVRPPEHQRSLGLVLQAEYLEQRYQREHRPFGDPLKGYYVMALGQVGRYWWLQARYDWMNKPADFGAHMIEPLRNDLASQRQSYAVVLAPTHFQSYKLEYSIIGRGGEIEYRTVVQVNFTIGSHPAHEY